MMLWVYLPVKDNLFLGVPGWRYPAATILEYVTGWGMEKLFKNEILGFQQPEIPT